MLEPNLALSQATLGQLLLEQGSPDDALPHCQAAAELLPNRSAVRIHLGHAYRALGRWDEACAAYREAVRLAPDSPSALANLGLALHVQGERAEAWHSLDAAGRLGPNDVEVWQHHYRARVIEEDYTAAVAAGERLTLLRPRDGLRHLDLAWALQQAGRRAEARAAYDKALGFLPRSAEVLNHLGTLHEEQGDRNEAESCYRRACRLDPRAAEPLSHLINLLREDVPDEERHAALSRLGDPGLVGWERINLIGALTQLHDARGEYPEAAAWAAEGNALALEQRRRDGRPYDPAQTRLMVDHLIEGFPRALFLRLAGAGDPGRRPVFVVGLPRSGTTLVEQILASHRGVHGAGELTLARPLFDSLAPAGGWTSGYRPRLEALERSEVRTLSQRYFASLDSLVARTCPGAKPDRIVDKLPDNAFNLGFLALLFPNATFIEVRRDPRDVATSCWLTNFRNVGWTSAFEHISGRFGDYRRLMAHWRTVLTVPVHELVYERLVDDFEREARRLLAACGLDWDPACARFHETSRPVRTAAQSQVRRPLYRTALARWRHYEGPLAELFAALGPVVNSASARPATAGT
jgi:Flp pilus assembly protein TadD